MTEEGSITRQLLAAIRTAASDPTLEWKRAPIRLTGGFWAEMWRVELHSDRDDLAGDLVARVMPNAELAARETAVQRHLAEHGYPTPAVRLAGPPGPDLDRAWMLMDHAAGQPLLDGLSGPSAIARLPKTARALPDQLAIHAARLHDIDPSPLYEELGATDLLRSIRDQAAGIGRPDLTAIADRLAGTRPPSGNEVICHGDLHPFNILSHESGDTVLDWSAAQLAHPSYDLAFTKLLLEHPPLSAPPSLEPVVRAAGRALARRFLKSYSKAAGAVDDHQMAWYTDLHALRILTEVATWRAEETLDDRPGHPFLALSPTAVERLRERSGVGLRPDVGALVRTTGTRRRLFARCWSILDAPADEQISVAKDDVLVGIDGTVVEIGAGRGSNFRRYAPGTRVIAFEPNRYMHGALIESAERNSIDLDLRTQDLRDARLEPESVSTVVSVLTLCSVPDRSDLVAEIHRVLRPGGRFLFVEHVAETSNRPRRMFQTLVRPAWKVVADGCDPLSETDDVIANAGFDRLEADRENLGPMLDPTSLTYWGVATK